MMRVAGPKPGTSTSFVKVKRAFGWIPGNELKKLIVGVESSVSTHHQFDFVVTGTSHHETQQSIHLGSLRFPGNLATIADKETVLLRQTSSLAIEFIELRQESSKCQREDSAVK